MTQSLHACVALARDNLIDGRKRAGYLVLTLAITVAAWLALSAMAAPFVDSGPSTGPGVTIRNGNQSNAPLPLRYAQRIKAIPGARDVAWFTLQLVYCKRTPEVQVTLNTYGGPGTASAVAQDHGDPATIARWQADPLGILIGDKTAADCGWHVRQGVEPPDVMGVKQLPLHITGIFHASQGDVAIAHFDYINRTDPLFGKDNVLYYLANGGSAHGNELLAARIEAAFAHDFPTVSATTDTTVQNAWTRYGKVQQLLAFVMLAILLCTASVLISVLAHAAAQRRAKFALLRVFGFRRATLFGAFALEVVLVLVLGAALGTGIGLWVTGWLATTTIGITSGGFVIPAWAYVWMPLWLAVLFSAAMVWPAALIARVRPVDYRAI